MIRRAAELQVALLFLTRLPAGRIGGTAPPLAQAAWAFPLVGLLVGAAGWLAVAAAAACGLPPDLGALLAVSLALGVTGGLHEDGLADMADGIGGGATQARKLAIMRDSRIGSYGAAALILALAARVLAIAELAPGSGGALLAAFVAAGTVSRAAIVGVLAALPPARDGGLGRAAGRPDRRRVAVAMLLAACCLLPLGGAAWAVLALAALAALGVAALARRQFGGQTGDVLGATQVVSEVAAWLALAAVAAPAP